MGIYYISPVFARNLTPEKFVHMIGILLLYIFNFVNTILFFEPLLKLLDMLLMEAMQLKFGISTEACGLKLRVVCGRCD